jgi:phage terminase large subunit-like protein
MHMVHVPREGVYPTLSETPFFILRPAHDVLYARHLAQQLQDEDGMHVVEFRQTMMAFSPPTTEFERLLIGGKVRHPRHPILSWQAGHVRVKSDANNNKRPVKPTPDDHRKIDGIVAAIMALGVMMRGPSRRRSRSRIWSGCESRGLGRRTVVS